MTPLDWLAADFLGLLDSWAPGTYRRAPDGGLIDRLIAPLRPYTLYNSWYDLRSAEYPRVTPDHVMNEENVLRMARLLRENSAHHPLYVRIGHDTEPFTFAFSFCQREGAGAFGVGAGFPSSDAGRCAGRSQPQPATPASVMRFAQS